MSVNSFERAGMFELTGELPRRTFKVINPFFFNFLKETPYPDEIIEALPGVTIVWSSEHSQPLVRFDSFTINEDAQLFHQLYSNQLVEV